MIFDIKIKSVIKLIPTLKTHFNKWKFSIDFKWLIFEFDIRNF